MTTTFTEPVFDSHVTLDISTVDEASETYPESASDIQGSNALTMCHDGPCSVIWIDEEHPYPFSLLAHEATHAANHAAEEMCFKTVDEEFVAYYTGWIVKEFEKRTRPSDPTIPIFLFGVN